MDGQTSTFIIWCFRAKVDRVEKFRRVYGSGGDWAKLFMQSPEYQGTQLLQNTTEERMFVVVDRWAGGDSFSRFRQEFSKKYEELDRQCLELTEEETRIGVFADVREADPPPTKVGEG